MNQGVFRLGLMTSSMLLLLSRLRNDLYCVGWGVKLYSLTTAVVSFASALVSGYFALF